MPESKGISAFRFFYGIGKAIRYRRRVSQAKLFLLWKSLLNSQKYGIVSYVNIQFGDRRMGLWIRRISMIYWQCK